MNYNWIWQYTNVRGRWYQSSQNARLGSTRISAIQFAHAEGKPIKIMGLWRADVFYLWHCALVGWQACQKRPLAALSSFDRSKMRNMSIVQYYQPTETPDAEEKKLFMSNWPGHTGNQTDHFAMISRFSSCLLDLQNKKGALSDTITWSMMEVGSLYLLSLAQSAFGSGCRSVEKNRLADGGGGYLSWAA